MIENKTCPYCKAVNSYTYWLNTKSSQQDLQGNKLGIELKLKIPKCQKCGNILRYWLDSYGRQIPFSNPKGI